MYKRKIILNLCTTLDGYIQWSKWEIDWCFTDQDYCMTDFLNNTDTIFIWRKSYEQLLEMAPDAFSDKKKIIFSKTLKNTDSLQVISDNIEDEVNKILKTPWKNIWLFWGASLLSTLLNLNLVDKLVVSIHPLLLWEWKSLVSDLIWRKKLKLTDTKSFDSWLVQVYYDIEK